MGAPDVAIIGAGAVGVATALSLTEAGKRVAVYDRDPPASGASHGNAGVISPWSCTPQALPGLWRNVPKWLLDPEGPLVVRPRHLLKFLPWAWRFLRAGQLERLPAIADAMFALSAPSVELYRRNLAGTGAEHLVRDCCYLHVVRDPATLNPESAPWRLRKKRGVPFRLVQGGELQEIEPALSPEYRAAMLVEGQARALDPGAVGRAVAAKAQALGAVFHQTEVKALRREGEAWVLETEAGLHKAPLVVLAAGAWSAGLLEPLGLSLPLEAERGYHLVLKNPGVAVRNSIMDVAGKFVASSMDAGLRCAGTAEFSGLDTPPDYRRAALFKDRAKRLFPGIDADDVDAWSGVRPSFPDSLPVIGPAPGLPNLILAFGHSHFGFGMAPATGRLVAQIIAGPTPNIDIAPYAAERFL